MNDFHDDSMFLTGDMDFSPDSKREIIVVPIEPLVERYTGDWYTEFPKEFKAAGFKVTVIDGSPLQGEVKVGTFLDINSTIHYKCSQLQAIARMFDEGRVKDGTVFFFGDLEFWGIESIRLMAQMNNVKVYLTAFLHAASYTREDAFSVAAYYQQYTELGWIAAMDKVFVGSEYHKQMVSDNRIHHLMNREFPSKQDEMKNKIVVTNNPIFSEKYPVIPVTKQKKVLLTNRFDSEKRPMETLYLFESIKAQYPDWEFVVTTSRSSFKGNNQADVEAALEMERRGIITIKAGLTKLEYYQELAESAIMVTHSIEENYGYCIAEALIYGCVPLMRKGLSHDEFSNDPRLFFTADGPDQDTVQLEHLICSFGTHRFPVAPRLDTSGMQNIINEIKTLN